MKYEYCCNCSEPTGKAGAGDDSLYTDHDGPFCEDCFPDKERPQRTWVGLTDEEILAVNMSTVTKLIDEPIVCDTDHNIAQLGKAIEAKLKEKNA